VNDHHSLGTWQSSVRVGLEEEQRGEQQKKAPSGSPLAPASLDNQLAVTHRLHPAAQRDDR